MAKKKGRKIFIWLAIVLVLAGLGTAAALRKHEAIITIQTEKVARHTLTEIVTANGKIQPVVQVKISPEVSGEIIELPVKEGQAVKKGDLLVKIKPDYYVAARNQAEASYKSALAGQATSEANERKARSEFQRYEDLFKQKLVSNSTYDEFQAAYDVARAQLTSAVHQVEMAHASLASADEQLSKTIISSPLTGTVSKLNSQLGERVLGTVQNIGTEIMTVADLNEMEARVDLGEIDVVLIAPNQNVRLEVDAFKDRKFSGLVTEIANSSTGAGLSSGLGGSQSQEATKFSVKIRIQEKEIFRPGMSVTAEIETRMRTNVIAVPIASVTTRMPKVDTNAVAGGKTNSVSTPPPASKAVGMMSGTSTNRGGRGKDVVKPVEVVFVLDGDHVKMAPVKIGISDDSFWEITEGLTEGQEVVSGGFRAISKDLEDGKKVKKGTEPIKEKDADKKRES